MKNKKLATVLTVLCGLVALFSLYKLIDYGVQNARTARLNAETVQLVSTEEPASVSATETDTIAETADLIAKATDSLPAVTPEPVASGADASQAPGPTATPMLKTIYSVSSNPTTPPVLLEMQSLKQKFKDTIGFLRIPCISRINFAIVQRNNTFYLNHDLTGASNVTGAAFLDEACSIWPRSRNLVIYAHNMKSGEMFGELNRMADSSILAKDPFVYFSTLYEEGTYLPIYIGVCRVEDVPFYRTDFSNEADFDAFFSILRQRSDVRLATEAVYGDDLLTLVTCVSSDSDDRFVVVLRKLRDGENPDIAKRSVFPNL